MNAHHKERPPLDFMGPYNVPLDEFPEHDTWVESDNVDELTADEFYEVNSQVRSALSKHGNVAYECEGEHDFYVYDGKFCDRTQKIELETSERLPGIIAPAVEELQSVLKKHSLWRAMFIGHGREEHAAEQFFVVYADVVRIRQLDQHHSTDDALVENARLRLAHFRFREELRRKRTFDLKAAICAAYEQIGRNDDSAVLVAWFDTVSFPNFDWGFEGLPGTSVWVLLRETISQRPDRSVKGTIRFSVHWATPDGAISDHEPRAPGACQLLHFRDTEEVHSEVAFDLEGERLQYARPEKKPSP